MNYGKTTVDWESFMVSVALIGGASIVIFCIMSQVLNKDYAVLETLRRAYRERVAQMRRRLRTVTYGQVN